MSLFFKIYKYIWSIVRVYKWTLLGIFILFTFRVVIDYIVIPLYFKDFIDLISGAGAEHSSISRDIFSLVFIIIVLHVFVTLTARSRNFLYIDFMANTIRDLRDFAFQRIEKNSYTFFSNTFAGSLVTKMRRFINAFDGMFEITLFNFSQIIILLFGIFIVLMRESILIGSLLLISVVIYMTVVAFLVKIKFKYDVLEAEQDSKISGRLADIFTNILTLKFFSARENEIKSFGEYTKEGEKRSRKAWFWGNIIDIFQSFFSLLVQAVFLYISAHLWIKNEISTGMVVLVQSYVTIILVRLWDLGNSLVRFMKHLSDMKETIDIFEIKPDILDPKNPEEIKIKKGLILFKDVSFKYDISQEVMSNLNFEIKPGERVGIVGHSGAGKSTITKLLLRFNDVTTGMITIDGQDIRNITQDDLRSVISYVPQEPMLFHRTVRENIIYGKKNATDEEVIDVSKKAHAHEFITKLPKGYNTKVGERGVKLSGGERQRIAIARAMLKPAPILILDEATSSLDSISESYIQDSFSELMKGKTTIVIAHRLSTIQKMDRIVVLDKGKIVEEGTHRELLEKGGIYKSLWEHQTNGFLE